MTSRRIHLALAAVFLIVGVLATANTLRLNSYIRETLPRDEHQEQCNTATIQVLQGWVLDRIRRDDAIAIRDDATIRVLDELRAGQEARPPDLQAWRDAVVADRQIRRDTTPTHLPLPNC